MKFNEKIDQFIQQFKGQIIGQHFQFVQSHGTWFVCTADSPAN